MISPEINDKVYFRSFTKKFHIIRGLFLFLRCRTFVKCHHWLLNRAEIRFLFFFFIIIKSFTVILPIICVVNPIQLLPKTIMTRKLSINLLITVINRCNRLWTCLDESYIFVEKVINMNNSKLYSWHVSLKRESRGKQT